MFVCMYVLPVCMLSLFLFSFILAKNLVDKHRLCTHSFFTYSYKQDFIFYCLDMFVVCRHQI